jgi:HK97 family phage portal protein
MLSNKYIVKLDIRMNKEPGFFKKMWGGRKATKSPSPSSSTSLAALATHATLGGGYTTFDTAMGREYETNSVVYRCVSLIARNISSVPLVLYQENQIIQSHPLLDLLKRPNSSQSYESFFESLVTYLLLTGNSYVYAVAETECPDRLGQLYVLRSDRLSVKSHTHGLPERYEYRSGNHLLSIPVDPETGQSALMHLKLFSPWGDNQGISPLKSAQSMIALQNTIVAHNISLLHNAGCPSGALIVKGANLTEEQVYQLREQLRTMKTKAGAGHMMLLNGPFEWKEMGLSPKDMDFAEGRTLASREIAQVFGVPPLCIGILGDSTYTSYQEARMHLWEDTLLPLLDTLVAQFNQWLVPYYGSDLCLGYNKDSIHALIPRREKLWDKVSTISCLTINEKRHMLGYPPLNGGDVLAAGSDRTALLQGDLPC